jgi:hypothetical protein
MQAKLRGSDGLASAKAAQSAGPSLCCYKPLLPADAKPCAERSVDGVIANQCLMNTVGFAAGYYRRAFAVPVPLACAGPCKVRGGGGSAWSEADRHI